jgi:hypothetical protein
MRYTLLMHYAEQTGATLSDEDMAEAQRAFSAYAAALHGAGVLIAAEVLRSSESTTTVSRVDGDRRRRSRRGHQLGRAVSLGELGRRGDPTRCDLHP